MEIQIAKLSYKKVKKNKKTKTDTLYFYSYLRSESRQMDQYSASNLLCLELLVAKRLVILQE